MNNFLTVNFFFIVYLLFSINIALAQLPLKSAVDFVAVGSVSEGDTYKPVVFRSFNQGESWLLSSFLPENVGISANATAVRCTANHCLLLGYYVNLKGIFPTLFISENEGNEWHLSKPIPNPLNKGKLFLYGIASDAKAMRAFAVGHSAIAKQEIPVVYQSEDGGASWAELFNFPMKEGAVKTNLLSIDCDNEAKCCVIAGYYSFSHSPLPLIYYTDNGGQNWNLSLELPVVKKGENYYLSQVRCEKESKYCVAVGYYSYQERVRPLVYTSEDGGRIWSLSSLSKKDSPYVYLHALACHLNECVAVGYAMDFKGFTSPLSYYSQDKGRTWQLSEALPFFSKHAVLSAVHCLNSNHCVAVGYSNETQAIPLSYVSSDSGIHWSLSSSLPPTVPSKDYYLYAIS